MTQTETKLTKAQQKELRERRRDYRDATSLMVSIASLGIGVAALCMNEKPEGQNDFEKGDKMSDCKNCNSRTCNGRSCTRSNNAKGKTPVRSRNELSTDEMLAKAKREKKEAAKARKAAKAQNQAAKARQKAERNSQQEKIRAYARSIGYSGPIITPNTKSDFEDAGYYGTASQSTKSTNKAWVAMEMNKRTGGDRQAIVCASKAEAEARAKKMKASHVKSSQRSKDCIQGYARIDVTQPIDIPGCFAGGCGLTRV